MASIIRVYKDKFADICFVEVIEPEYLNYAKQHKSEPLFTVLDGSEKVYSSELPLFELREVLFEKIIKPNENFRMDQSYHIHKDNKLCGTSFSFSNQVYEGLNKDIKEKLGLEELI